MTLRRATPQDLPALAQLWHDCWHEAHAAHVPEALTRLRTLPNFYDRLAAFGDQLRMSGTATEPLGFCTIKGDELDQLYVSPKARGTGLATMLIEDGEARLKASGVHEAHLLCVIQNDRAARFYEKCGWHNDGIQRDYLDTSEGPFEIECLVFRKTL